MKMDDVDFLLLYYFRQIEELHKDTLISEEEVRILCFKVREILIEESNVQKVNTPVTVS
jgi:hypothetical protein